MRTICVVALAEASRPPIVFIRAKLTAWRYLQEIVFSLTLIGSCIQYISKIVLDLKLPELLPSRPSESPDPGIAKNGNVVGRNTDVC